MSSKISRFIDNYYSIVNTLLRININLYRALLIDRSGLNRETRSTSAASRFKGDRTQQQLPKLR